MKILISTGIFPPEIGGPAHYAKNLRDEFKRQGFGVDVATFGIEKKLPTGVRHTIFFFKILWSVFNADAIILLDTFSVALPTVLAAKLFGKQVVVRIGGDFLWESYVERTRTPITLDVFYADKKHHNSFTQKEKIIFKATRYVLEQCRTCVFTTEWQEAIWKEPYNLHDKSIKIISNFIGEKLPTFPFERKIFLWAGRPIFLKNVDLLKKAFEVAQKKDSTVHLECVQTSQEILHAKIAQSYAVIIPSLSEVSPNLVLDAIRYDKPFIVTKHTGLTDVLNTCGIMVDPLSLDDIVEKILFLSDETAYITERKKIQQFTMQHSWKEIAQEFIALFDAHE